MEDQVTHKPGIYFNMPFSDYLALPALSASGIKNLSVSSMDFWANSWMNTNKPEEKEAKHFLDGKAYHARILEGLDVFESQFIAEFDASKYPDALNKTDQIKDWLREAKKEGHDIKLTGNKPFLIEQIQNIDPTVEIIDVLKADYARAWPGYEFIDLETMGQIELAAAMIEKHPELSKCFQGGYPEVTILWVDEAYNIPMKARIDYLKPQAIVDLKTFANSNRKPIDRAIYGDIAANKYHVQAAVYHKAVEIARGFAASGMIEYGGRVVRDEWLESFAGGKDPQFVFVFQQKGIAPVSRGKIFPKGLVYDCALQDIREAMEKFIDCQETFGAAPWVDIEKIERLDDEGFPAWIAEA